MFGLVQVVEKEWGIGASARQGRFGAGPVTRDDDAVVAPWFIPFHPFILHLINICNFIVQAGAILLLIPYILLFELESAYWASNRALQAGAVLFRPHSPQYNPIRVSDCTYQQE